MGAATSDGATATMKGCLLASGLPPPAQPSLPQSYPGYGSSGSGPRLPSPSEIPTAICGPCLRNTVYDPIPQTRERAQRAAPTSSETVREPRCPTLTQGLCCEATQRSLHFETLQEVPTGAPGRSIIAHQTITSEPHRYFQPRYVRRHSHVPSNRILTVLVSC